MTWVLFMCFVATGRCEAVAASPTVGECVALGKEMKARGRTFDCRRMRVDYR